MVDRVVLLNLCFSAYPPIFRQRGTDDRFSSSVVEGLRPAKFHEKLEGRRPRGGSSRAFWAATYFQWLTLVFRPCLGSGERPKGRRSAPLVFAAKTFCD